MCNQSPFTNQHHNHIITGNLDIVTDPRLRHLISKGPKYRENNQFSCIKAKEEIMKGIDSCIESWRNKVGTSLGDFKDWKNAISFKIDERISKFGQTIRRNSPVLKDRASSRCLNCMIDLSLFQSIKHLIMWHLSAKDFMLLYYAERLD